MERFVGKVAVVTGSSFGIGESIAKELLKRGVHVVGLARNVPRLQEIDKEIKNDSKTYLGKFFFRRCDVRIVQDIKDSFNWIQTNVKPVSILVNNAGVLLSELACDLKEESFDETFDTNVKGSIMCAKEAIKSMLDNNIDGHILNMNSISGQIMLNTVDGSFNNLMLYCASKHAAKVFSEALRRDMNFKKANIKITTVCPGPVKTEMSNRWFANSAPLVDQATDPNIILCPKDIADACISVIDTAPQVLISEITVIPLHPVLT